MARVGELTEAGTGALEVVMGVPGVEQPVEGSAEINDLKFEAFQEILQPNRNCQD